jgi:hypothetical protein
LQAFLSAKHQRTVCLATQTFPTVSSFVIFVY